MNPFSKGKQTTIWQSDKTGALQAFQIQHGCLDSTLYLGGTLFKITNSNPLAVCRGQWRKWRPYDMEVGELRDRLTEFPLAFPPTYPFAEDPNTGTSYMRTRCPAWCDRVLMSHEARSLLVKPAAEAADQADQSFHYDVIGKDVCMGDHKPVFLWCQIGLTAPQQPRAQQPRVESPSYTDLLNSPPASNGGCLRFTDIKDPSTVKLFKETTV